MDTPQQNPNQTTASPKALLTPSEVTLILTDMQPGLSFAAQSRDHQVLLNNAVALTKTAQVFGVPTIFTTSSTKAFSGPMFPEVQAVFPDQPPLERTSMNCFQDPAVVAAVEKAGRRKLIFAGLLTEACLTFPVLSALEQGYDVYVVADASAGSTATAHDTALQRMMQAGMKPLTWMQILLEFQRDWTHAATYAPAVAIVKAHSGAYGIALTYAKEVMAPAK